MPSKHLILSHPFSFCLQSFPTSWSFPMSWLFVSGGQSFGQRASCVSVKQCPFFQATSSPKAHDLHKPSQAFFLLSNLDSVSWEIPDKKSWFLRMGRELWHFCQCRSNYLLLTYLLTNSTKLLRIFTFSRSGQTFQTSHWQRPEARIHGLSCQSWICSRCRGLNSP